MKKIVLTFAIALMGFSATYAQQQGKKQELSPEQRAEKSTARLEKELNLKPDQKQKVYALELNKFKQHADRFEKVKAERTQQREESMKLMKQNNEQLNKVLTAEQQTKLAALRKEKRGSHRGGMRGEMRNGTRRGKIDSTRVGKRERMKDHSMRADSTSKL